MIERAQHYSVAPYAGAWIETTLARIEFAKLIVAPYAGAWIETNSIAVRSVFMPMSHPTRVRGLKRLTGKQVQFKAMVAPYAGAWIETRNYRKSSPTGNVAPYAGAWIETTDVVHRYQTRSRRTLRGCVD